jgi:hypothetical protein
MRKSLVVLTILPVFASGCGEPPKLEPQAIPQTTSSSRPSIAPGRDIVSSGPTTVPAAVKAAITTTTPVCAHPDTATTAASAFVASLIDGKSEASTMLDGELWQRVVADGTIIQTTPLNEAAGRATVAVSVAFERTADLAIVDPIGLRIELTQIAGCWKVDTVGYL